MLLLKTAGILLMVLALLHAGFPHYFNWKQELMPLSLMNRQMFQVHTFFLALILFLFGSLSFCEAEALSVTPLGKTICKGFAAFWAIRLLFQWTVYSSKLWRGKRFETIVHWLFTALWLFLVWVYACVGFVS